MRTIELSVYSLNELKQVNEKGYERALKTLTEWALEGDWCGHIFEWWSNENGDSNAGYAVRILEFNLAHWQVETDIDRLVIGQDENGDEILEDVEDFIERKRDIHNQILRDLLVECEHLMSEAYLLEWAEMNEWEFYDNGEVV